MSTSFSSLVGAKRFDAPRHYGWGVEGEGMCWRGMGGGEGWELVLGRGTGGVGRVVGRWWTLSTDDGGGSGDRGGPGDGEVGGLLGFGEDDGLGGGGGGSGLGLREMLKGEGGGGVGLGGGQRMEVVGAPMGVAVGDKRWVEFVLATGAAVVKGEERDVKKVLKALGS